MWMYIYMSRRRGGFTQYVGKKDTTIPCRSRLTSLASHNRTGQTKAQIQSIVMGGSTILEHSNIQAPRGRLSRQKREEEGVGKEERSEVGR